MKQLKLIIAALFLISPFAANADPIDLIGSVTTATGAFVALTPPGTPVSGPLEIDPVAIALGSAGPGDIESIDVNVGGFCFTTGPDASACPLGGSVVPIISIDFAALTFSLGNLGGFLDVTSFSPSFGVNIPITFNFDAGTFFGSNDALGTVSGNIAGTYAFTPDPPPPSNPVPEPGTLALLGLGLAGMGMIRRKKIV